LVANYRQGVSSLIQPSFVATATDYSTQMAREERFQNELNEAKEQMKLMQQQLAAMMESQRADTSTGTSQVHPLYDEAHDDQPHP